MKPVEEGCYNHLRLNYGADAPPKGVPTALWSATPLFNVCTTPRCTFHYSTQTNWSWKQQLEATPHQPLRAARHPKTLTKTKTPEPSLTKG